MKVLATILMILFIGVGLYLSYVVGETVVSNAKNDKKENPYIRVIASIALGAFLIYSFFEIMKMATCNSTLEYS